MKTKSSIRMFLLVFMTMLFVGCPSHYISDDYPETDISAYIYSPADSLYLRYYTVPQGKSLQVHEDTLWPSYAIRRIDWYSAQSPIFGEFKYDTEYNDLHAKKLSNETVSYVMRYPGVIINGKTYSWEEFLTRDYTSGEESPSSSLPYIEQVIDTLIIYFPDAVVLLNDQKEHSIFNKKDLGALPSITINN